MEKCILVTGTMGLEMGSDSEKDAKMKCILGNGIRTKLKESEF